MTAIFKRISFNSLLEGNIFNEIIDYYYVFYWITLCNFQATCVFGPTSTLVDFKTSNHLRISIVIFSEYFDFCWLGIGHCFIKCFHYTDIKLPENRKLRPVPKVPSYPHGVKPPKMMKMLHLMRNPEPVHNKLIYKQFGIQVRSTFTVLPVRNIHHYNVILGTG